LQSVFNDLGNKKGDFPVSEEASEKIFSLPMHPYLEVEEIKLIVETIKSAL
jgi:dTDP-4-amino-4,6-dideoxygalactose transaminase